MSEPITMESVVAATSEQVSCQLGDEAAILNLGNCVYYGLDPVGARIWNLVQEPKVVSDLRAAIIDEYEVEAERCEADLLRLLEELRSEGLIQLKAADAKDAE
jgi:Coenzyme PQQ synthesis protein D (PqqD)